MSSVNAPDYRVPLFAPALYAIGTSRVDGTWLPRPEHRGPADRLLDGGGLIIEIGAGWLLCEKIFFLEAAALNIVRVTTSQLGFITYLGT